MVSLQRRLEQYRIIYTWKVIEGLVPNCGVEVKLEGGRLDRKCKIPSIQKQTKRSVQTLREQTFQVNGPQLFNSIPASVRNMTKCGVDEFKQKLDAFLENLPDEPNVPGLVPGACTSEARPSNSILDQVKRIQVAPPAGQLATETHGG